MFRNKHRRALAYFCLPVEDNWHLSKHSDFFTAYVIVPISRSLHRLIFPGKVQALTAAYIQDVKLYLYSNEQSPV
jgi:hypothetical protein